MNPEHYVTVNNGEKSTLALGPYLTDMQARYAVKRVREFLEANDSNAGTYGYGTFRVPANGRLCSPGTLNKRLGL